MRQLIDDFQCIDGGEFRKPLSKQRENEIKNMVDSSKSIKIRVNTIYRRHLKNFKSQWYDNSVPCENKSNFWEDVLESAANEIMAFFQTNLPEIKTTSEENFAVHDCICEGYLKSDEFSLVIKLIKNNWKKELIVRDFK